MSLRARLTLVAVFVITTVALAISYFALLSAERAEVSRIDAVLNGIYTSVATAADPVSVAMQMAEDSDIGVTVAFVNYASDVTEVIESRINFKPAPSSELLSEALSYPVSVNAAERYRMRTFMLSPDEYLAFASSLKAIDENRADNIQTFTLVVVFGISFGVLLVLVLTRRDIRVITSLIKAADDISQGDTSVAIPKTKGNAEVDQLAAALGRMVQSLQRVVEVEQETQVRMQQFMGDASHELRTPLTVIKGYVSLLNNPAFTEAQRARAFERLEGEINRMEFLIKDLLLLAELGQTREDHETVVNFSGLVHESVDDLRVLGSERSVTSSVVDGAMVVGTEHLLQQLLANIAGNIDRHTPPDAPVFVELVLEGTLVHLVVEDGGPGLSAEMLERGVQAFERFDKSRARESGGSGLGVSIMAAIVARHGGSIELSRGARWGGLRIDVRLPFSVPPAVH